MSGIDLDMTELLGYIDHLESVDGGQAFAGVVSKGAMNIKQQQQTEAKQSQHFRLASLISYDRTVTTNEITAVIGPRAVGAGKLGNIAYFGGSNGGGGTIADPMGALKAEQPRFEKAISDVIVELLR